MTAQPSQHLFCLEAAPEQRDSEVVRVVPATEAGAAHARRPVFRSATLPTPHQFNSELPFFVNFRPKDFPAA